MTEAKATMNVRQATDTVNVVDIEGEITAFCEDMLAEAYQKASQTATRSIILNFDGLDYMNSGGIGLLVTMLIRANRHGQKLAAYGLNDHYRQIFQLTRLDEAIGIYEDEPTALAAVS